jgi:hypothetical protein
MPGQVNSNCHARLYCLAHQEERRNKILPDDLFKEKVFGDAGNLRKTLGYVM